jgi:hypothetical protein
MKGQVGQLGAQPVEFLQNPAGMIEGRHGKTFFLSGGLG